MSTASTTKELMEQWQDGLVHFQQTAFGSEM